MARYPGENNRTPTRTCFHLLPDVRRGHGIFPSPHTWRISPGCGRGRRIIRDDHDDSGECRVSPLRNLQLRAPWFRITSQSRILAWQRLFWNRTERGFHDWNAALA